jgi:hypothetical protein
MEGLMPSQAEVEEEGKTYWWRRCPRDLGTISPERPLVGGKGRKTRTLIHNMFSNGLKESGERVDGFSLPQ